MVPCKFVFNYFLIENLNQLVKYAMKLEFDEVPNYDYIIKTLEEFITFGEIFQNLKFTQFEWIVSNF